MTLTWLSDFRAPGVPMVRAWTAWGSLGPLIGRSLQVRVESAESFSGRVLVWCWLRVSTVIPFSYL